MYIGIAGKAMVSNTTLAWLGNGDVRPRTTCMLRDPGVKSATGEANVGRRAPRATILIYYTGSQSTREVVFVTKHGNMLVVYCESKDASKILSLSDWGPKYGSLK